VFAKDPALNGINAQRSRTASAVKKSFFAINSKDDRTPFAQAVLDKTKESYGL
jgi:hypothetical protein